MPSRALNIFGYSDYREFLKDWLVSKQKTPHFSLRGFSRRAGFASHNILQLVIRGERGISPRSVPKYVKALGLSRDEAAYFEQLVLLGTTASSQQLMRQIEARRKSPESRSTFQKRQLAMFKQWLAPIVCEMTRLQEFREDSAWIAGRLGGRISAPEVTMLLAHLEASGLLERQNGRLQLADKPLDTGDNVVNDDLFAYHETALAKADDALWEVVPERRSFQVLTLALTSAAASELTQLIENFESEVLRLTDRPGPKTEIFQVSLQSFPVLTENRPRRKGTDAPHTV